jgi:hypothetical protein
MNNSMMRMAVFAVVGAALLVMMLAATGWIAHNVG